MIIIAVYQRFYYTLNILNGQDITINHFSLYLCHLFDFPQLKSGQNSNPFTEGFRIFLLQLMTDDEKHGNSDRFLHNLCRSW